MKIRLLIIGIFTFVGVGAAHAQVPPCVTDPDLVNLLNITPVGIYVQDVFKRVDAGVQQVAIDASSTGSWPGDVFYWIARVTGAIFRLVDTDLRITEYERDLSNNTACLHIDIALLEAKMEDVRCRVEDARVNGQQWSIVQLLSIQDFINERYRHLVNGATDPSYQDGGWQPWQIFDPPENTWCCASRNPYSTCEYIDVKECKNNKSGAAFPTLDQCGSFCQTPENTADIPPAREVVCPFDTDYLPPTGAGYGCSIQILNQIAGYPPVESERDSLQVFTDERNNFLNAQNIAHIKDAYVRMLEFQGRPIPPELANFGAATNTPHQRRYGCYANLTPNGPVPPQLENTWPQGAIALENRGPFSIEKNHIVLLRSFFEVSRKWAALREVADYLKNVSELPSSASQQDKDAVLAQQIAYLGFGRSIKEYMRELVRSVNVNQAGLESAIFPKAADGQLRLIEIMKPVRPIMSRIAKTVETPQEGVRAFAKNYAYFLRRSCIYRSCNERLERIIRILLADECFPYANGEYKNGAAWWQQCQNAINN